MQQDSNGDSPQLPWLEQIRQPSHVEKLLEGFAEGSSLIPRGCYRILDPERLPERLRRLLPQDSAHTWVCLSHGTGSWLFVGAIFGELSQTLNAPVLWLSVYGADGKLIELGIWVAEHGNTWRRYASPA